MDLIDNCTLTNSIGLYLSPTLRELLSSHKVQTVVKLFHLYKVIAPRQMYIAPGQIYIAPGQIYELMSDKYITSLLLIKILKAFLRVNIKSQFTNSHCY